MKYIHKCSLKIQQNHAKWAHKKLGTYRELIVTSRYSKGGMPPRLADGFFYWSKRPQMIQKRGRICICQKKAVPLPLVAEIDIYRQDQRNELAKDKLLTKRKRVCQTILTHPLFITGSMLLSGLRCLRTGLMAAVLMIV